MKNSLPKSMYIPQEIIMLFRWMEEKSFVYEEDGQLKGYLLNITEEENRGIYFSSENREIWHFRDNKQAKKRFFPIAYENSEYSDGCLGLWLDDKGEQHIVIIGDSSSSPMPFFVLGEPIIPLQLLAIGYYSIFSWCDYWQLGLSDLLEEKFMLCIPAYRKWLEETFNVVIPKTASKILPHFVCINDESASDIFWRWDREYNGLWEDCRYKKALYDKLIELFPKTDLKREGFYNHIDLSLFGEVMLWLESDDVDTEAPEVARAIKDITTWVRSTEQPEENYGCIHFYTEYIVSFVEEIFHNKKLHHLIPYNIYTKEDVFNNKEFIMGYMSVSEDDYLHVLSLFDKIEEE
jgi:hypothetical protein